MKKIILLSVAALSLGFQAWAKKEMAVENRTVTAFDKIVASGVYDLQLVQGGADSVVVEADAKRQKEVMMEVKEDGTLMLWTPQGASGKKTRCKVRITYKNLNALCVQDVAKVETKNAIKSENLDVLVAGCGSVLLNLDVDHAKMQLKKTRSVELQGTANQLLLKNNSNGWLNTQKLKSKVYSNL